MVKHNNVTPNVHFRKWWQRYVKLWFDQPGKKKARRLTRQKKAAAASPLPVDSLRPLVRPQSQRYNVKLRPGRGFTLCELKAAGISKKVARTLQIAVDHRRRSHSDEALNLNVNRLKTYMSKIVLLPRDNKLKKGFGGMPDDVKITNSHTEQQVSVAEAVPFVKEKKKLEARAITEEERNFSAYATLRKALIEKKNVGKVKAKQEEIA